MRVKCVDLHKSDKGYKNNYLPKNAFIHYLGNTYEDPWSSNFFFFPPHTEEVRDGSILGSPNLQLDATSTLSNYLEDESVEGLF